MNNKINELYKVIEAKDKIINEQALEIARLNNELELNNIEYNTNITWWSNRFNAVERDNRKLKEDKKKAIEYIKTQEKYMFYVDWREVLKILGDKE